MTRNIFTRLVITAGLISASVWNVSSAYAQRFDQGARPHCQVSRMQVPTGGGLEWKQIVDCPND
jgi:hypothetical protein